MAGKKNLFGWLVLVLLATVLFGHWQAAWAEPKETQKAPPQKPANLERAIFASGCFWKTQFIFNKANGVVRTTAGYTGGTMKNPTYEQVCSHKSGHAEALEIEYDPAKTTYRKLLEVFFANHDPTTLNKQGPDEGTQYRSAIFYTTDKQKQEATKYEEELSKAHRFNAPIVTEIVSATKFYPAEEYHQDYFAKHGAVCN